MAFCINCGAQIKPEMKFCDNCGTPVSGVAPEQSAEQGGAAQAQASYAPPVQQAQGSYTPPVQQAQGSYTPPVQQAQESYTPPVQQAQESYTPPVQQAQESYTPPVQQAQGSYAPPVQQAQASYTPPMQQAQASYAPPMQAQYGAQAAYEAPQAPPKQKKPINKKALLFGGIGLAVVLIAALLIILLGGGGKGDPYIGVWEGVTLGEGDLSIDVKNDMGGITFDIKKGGACVAAAGGESFDGTWEKTKDGIQIKAIGLTLDCKIDGKDMVIENYGGTGMTLILKKVGDGGDDPVSKDPNAGVWNVVSAEMWGVETDISDVFENGFTIELLDEGKCKLNIDGTEGNGKWSLKGSELTIKGGGLDTTGTLKDGVLVLEDVMGMGLNLHFQKEGAAPKAGRATPSISDAPNITDINKPIAPAFKSPTTSIELDSNWYGTMVISNCEPSSYAIEREGTFDIWGYIGVTNEGRAYMEVFDMPATDATYEDFRILSIYIDLYPEFIEADIGDKDAWVMDGYDSGYLDKSAEVYFSPYLDNGALYMYYRNQDASASYDMMLFLREDGAPWDEENDPLPPSYELYKAYISNSDPGDMPMDEPEDVEEPERLPAAKLREAYDAMDPSGMTYEEVRDLYFNGVEAEIEPKDDPNFKGYVWRAQEDSYKALWITFKKNDAGKYIYNSRSISNIPKPE